MSKAPFDAAFKRVNSPRSFKSSKLFLSVFANSSFNPAIWFVALSRSACNCWSCSVVGACCAWSARTVFCASCACLAANNPPPMVTVSAAVTAIFWRVVMAMVARVKLVPVKTAVVMLAASAAGAALTAFAATAVAMAVAPNLMPCLARRARSLSRARFTRTRAASSVTPKAAPTSAKVLFSKKRSSTASRSAVRRACMASSNTGASCCHASFVSFGVRVASM